MRSHHIAICVGYVAILLLLPESSNADPFRNLGFEEAVVSATTPSNAPVADLLPGWTVRFDETIQSTAWFNLYSLDANSVELHAQPTEFVIAGTYSVFMQAADLELNAPRHRISIEQTGRIGSATKSLRFRVRNPWYQFFDPPRLPGPFEVSIGGQVLPLVMLSSSNGDITFGADVTPWSGLDEALRFTVLSPASFGHPGDPVGWMALDSIVLSGVAIPEPINLGLIAFCCLIGSTRKRIANRALQPL